MVALKTHFDGERILTPPELRGASPGEVVVVVTGLDAAATGVRPSVFDVLGKAEHPRTAEDIEAQIREEREEWGDR